MTDTSSAKFTDISRQVSPCFATKCLCWYLPNALVDESGMIRTQMGKHTIRKRSQCMGRFVWYQAVSITSNQKVGTDVSEKHTASIFRGV